MRADPNEPTALWRKKRCGTHKNFIEWIDLGPNPRRYHRINHIKYKEKLDIELCQMQNGN